MRKLRAENSKPLIFLGVDGGQSHTEALIADESGHILGRGLGGASNHAEQPGGRERLKNAVLKSVGEALGIDAKQSGKIPKVFASAHCGMTGGAVYKEEIISEILTADELVVGHDAPTALYGATAGKPGVVVIAGTGSVVFGENIKKESARAGGLGFLFADEGSGFWLAVQAIRLAIKEADGILPEIGVRRLVLDYFRKNEIREITDAFYNEKLPRDELAKFARTVHDAAMQGNNILRDEIICGIETLCRCVESVARKLKFNEHFPVAGVGGMFRGALYRETFIKLLNIHVPRAIFIEPQFGPATGALLLAYRQAGVEITEDLLSNLEKTTIK